MNNELRRIYHEVKQQRREARLRLIEVHGQLPSPYIWASNHTAICDFETLIPNIADTDSLKIRLKKLKNKRHKLLLLKMETESNQEFIYGFELFIKKLPTPDTLLAPLKTLYSHDRRSYNAKALLINNDFLYRLSHNIVDGSPEANAKTFYTAVMQNRNAIFNDLFRRYTENKWVKNRLEFVEFLSKQSELDIVIAIYESAKNSNIPALQRINAKIDEYVNPPSKLEKLRLASLENRVNQVYEVESVNDTMSKEYLLCLLNYFYPDPSSSSGIKKSYEEIEELINKNFLYRFVNSLVDAKDTNASSFYRKVTYIYNSIKRTFANSGIVISEMEENQILNEISNLETLDKCAMLPEIKIKIKELRALPPPPPVL